MATKPWARNMGGDGLAQLHLHDEVGVIVLDLQMPVLDGPGFRVEQQRDPALRRIPVIVLSAHQDCVQTARQLGAAAAIRKPFHPDTLVEAIRAILAPQAASLA